MMHTYMITSRIVRAGKATEKTTEFATDMSLCDLNNHYGQTMPVEMNCYGQLFLNRNTDIEIRITEVAEMDDLAAADRIIQASLPRLGKDLPPVFTFDVAISSVCEMSIIVENVVAETEEIAKKKAIKMSQDYDALEWEIGGMTEDQSQYSVTHIEEV